MATLGNEAVAYSRVTKYLRTAQFNPIKSLQTPMQVHLSAPRRLQQVALEEKPLSSVRRLAHSAHVPPTAVYRRLMNSLGALLRHFRWLLHLLSDAQKLHGVESSLSFAANAPSPGTESLA
jgi:hypothetical protein